MATTPDKNGDVNTYIVARYSPPGNFLGQFEENVGKSKYFEGCLQKYIDIQGTEPTHLKG